jgi:hypothetical protein
MRYTSPQIVSMLRATDAIQSVGHSIGAKNLFPLVNDNPETLPQCTPGAYESDE